MSSHKIKDKLNMSKQKIKALLTLQGPSRSMARSLIMPVIHTIQ